MAAKEALAAVIFFLALSCGPSPGFSFSTAFLSKSSLSDKFEVGENGGVTCAGCSIVVGLAEQLTALYNKSVDEALKMLCDFLPKGFHEACVVLVNEYGPAVIKLLEAKETPDIICYAIDLCIQETQEICHLFPLPKQYRDFTLAQVAIKKAKSIALDARARKFSFPDLCSLPLVKEICEIFEKFGNQHFPVDDLDHDDYSDYTTFRGTSWRGKDCNDVDANIHPGIYTTKDDIFDTNCNGILGIAAGSGQTYEALWCNDTQQMGVAVLGDSVGAHFHIPPEWLISRDLNADTFKDLFFILENEFDWPELSASTGYKNSTWSAISGPVNSTYLLMRERNRCIHRDYQNIAVNGARSSSMMNDIVKSFSRNPKTDNPVLILFELLGNDVCNSHHDMSHMTTPEEFYANNLKSFQYIDSIVPAGSKLIAFGLGQGTVLYDSLHNRTHPIGSLRNDVTYSDFYDYLNCLYVSPCFGWMNTNVTWRNATQERANELSAAMKQLVEKNKFKNFKPYYMDAPFNEVFDLWRKRGGEDWQLIEPVDGFHPNQIANALTAEVLWEITNERFPDLLPPPNPHNKDIIKKFGDQGGY